MKKVSPMNEKDLMEIKEKVAKMKKEELQELAEKFLVMRFKTNVRSKRVYHKKNKGEN